MRPILIADEMEQRRCAAELRVAFERAIHHMVDEAAAGRLTGRSEPEMFRLMKGGTREALERWWLPDTEVEMWTAARTCAAVTTFVVEVKWPPRHRLRPGSAVSTFLAVEPPAMGESVKAEAWEGLTLTARMDVSDEVMRSRPRRTSSASSTRAPYRHDDTVDAAVYAAKTMQHIDRIEAAPVSELHDADFAERMRRKRRRKRERSVE